MDQALAVYLPVDRRHALATGTPLPERTQGAVLFADISGFTPLTEALTRELGARRGAEELSRHLNLVYDALICEVERYGGNVIGFAGDAITCWFDGDSGLRATACALAMQAAMRAFVSITLPSGGTASLAMKVAVAAGAVRRFLVGDPRIQLIDTLAGATLSRMAAAEQVAQKGEVALDEGTAQALDTALEIQAWRTDERGAHFAVIAGLRVAVAPQPSTLPAPGSLRAEELRPWLLPTVYERLQAGQGEFLTELRPAVALFLRFGGIDYDADPEAGQKLNAFIRWVQSLLAQYEGTLLSLTMGDKGSYLYLAFGAPIAHEDDACRAARAAHALRLAPEGFAFLTGVQIGISQGTMLTGAYGGATRRTYGSLGDEVNLAARLMQHARPGEIIVSHRVQRATETLFTWQGPETIRVKGKRDPITVFALQGAAQAPTLRLTAPPYRLPMIGRAAELALLADKVALARQGQGQLVGITGEAGMGKSRFVAEAIRLAQGFTGYGGECQSYGTTTPYLVWQSIWRAFFGLSPSASPEQQVIQVAHTIRALDPALLPRLPLLAPALGLSLPDNDLTRTFSPELRNASRLTLLVDLLKAQARQQGALLLVLEDCHWLDAASHELLEVVGRAIWQVPVLILLTYRPSEPARLDEPRVAALPHFSLLHLTELNASEMGHLIAQRLGHLYPHEERLLPARLVTQLVARAQGNPFYLEELLNYLHDQGLDPFEIDEVAEVELPSSLHTLILSRIDRLNEPQKVTLKVASIIGRLFRFRWLVGYYPALGEPDAVRRDLEVLQRLELTPLEQVEPELVYLFKHIVTQEVAYASLPYATRAQLHEQLAAYLELQGAGAVEGYLDLLAYHYALSENRAKAGEYLWRAGDAAQITYANDAAQRYYERLLRLGTEPEAQVEIHLRLAAVRERVGAWDEAEAHLQAARRQAQAVGQKRSEAQSSLALGKLAAQRGRYDEAQRWLAEALTQWEALGDPAGRSQTLTEWGTVALRQGEYDRAQGYLEQSRVLCQAGNDAAGLARVLNSLAVVARNQGTYAEAQALFEESLTLRRALGDKQDIAISLNNLGVLVMDQGNYGAAQALYEESLTLEREIGAKQGIAISLNNLGGAALHQGNYGAAQVLFEESLVLRQELGDKRGIAMVLTNLGHVARHQGRYERAQTLYEESLALYRELGEKWSIAVTLTSLGHVAYRRADEVGAPQYYRAAVRLAHETGGKAIVTEALVGLAALMGQRRRPERLRLVICLLSATEEFRTAIGETLEPMAQALYDEALAATRAALSETDFAAAWIEGQSMSLDEAVTLALAEEGFG